MNSRSLFNWPGGLAAKMLGMAFLLGALVWFASEDYKNKNLSLALEEHLQQLLAEQSQRDRLSFDHFVKSFQQTAGLIANQHNFHRYVEAQSDNWRAAPVRYWQDTPDWFLPRSALRALAVPDFALLLDDQGQVRESYAASQRRLPSALENPALLLLEKSHDQTYMAILDDDPYLLSAVSQSVAGRKVTLQLGALVDDRMLMNLGGDSSRLLALVAHNSGRILVSSDPGLLPPGATLQELSNDFVISERSFHDYGGAEMLVGLSSFQPREQVAQMQHAMASVSTLQHALSGLALVLGPMLVILWISMRVRRLTLLVEKFTAETLRGKQAGKHSGDELQVLEQSSVLLMSEVLDSHQVIRAETQKEIEWKNTLQQQEQQLQLLLTITDVLNVGVLSQNGSLRAENSLMQRWADSFGGIEGFVCVDGLCGQQVLANAAGEESVFELRCLCLDDRRTVVLVKDLTAQLKNEREREQLQAELLQAQKMESIGRLAGGVAHDFNNILMAISGNLQLMKRRVDADNPIQKYMQVIDDSARRAADLTRQLLGFSRKQIIAPKPLALNQVVSDLLQMLKRLIGENIRVKTQLADGLWPVLIDRSQVEQIVMNLTVNARDAMAEGGTLLIESANVSLSAEYARQHMGVEAGEYVCLSISDTGCGIDAEAQKLIFEPFYTSKPQGQGTGLGLSMVFGIVKQNKGNIYVYSEPGKGTTFRIYLPRTRQQVSSEKLPAVTENLPRGTETILLVEDDAGVRSFAVELLSELGYTVLEASDAEEAVQLFEKYHGKIHLLLTDVVLPKMNGQQLASLLLERSSALMVIFMSGYTKNAIVEHGVLKEGVTFLPKPLALGTLAQAVRSALDPQVK